MQNDLQERVQPRAEDALHHGVHARVQAFLQLRPRVQERSPPEVPVRDSAQVPQRSSRAVQVGVGAELRQGAGAALHQEVRRDLQYGAHSSIGHKSKDDLCLAGIQRTLR